MQSQLMQSLHQIFNFIVHNQVTLTSLIMFIFFSLFLLSWLIEPRRLINGLIFTAFGISFLVWSAILIISQHNPLLTTSFFFSCFGYPIWNLFLSNFFLDFLSMECVFCLEI